MPFIEGENLAESLSARGPFATSDAVRCLREVAWALAYAHARGVIHRDVKPENIMIERGSGRAIVTDFGIARVEFGPVLAQDALIVGTASYMSPEQIDGAPLDGRSDLYSLGVVGFLLLSGTLPLTAGSVSALLAARRTQSAPPLAVVAPAVPGPIAAVIDRCLAADPAARYPTGESLADALEKALRLSEPALARTGEFTVAALSASDAVLAWQRAAALQIASLSESTAPFLAEKAMPHVTTRDLEAAATAAGIQARFVRRAVDEITATRATERR
jgi:serine/threonine-protein kinase